MNFPYVYPECGTVNEALFTGFTDMVAFAGVGPHVSVKVPFAVVLLLTHGTFELLLPSVPLHVFSQVTSHHEALIALPTFPGFISPVLPLMHVQI